MDCDRARENRTRTVREGRMMTPRAHGPRGVSRRGGSSVGTQSGLAAGTEGTTNVHDLSLLVVLGDIQALVGKSDRLVVGSSGAREN